MKYSSIIGLVLLVVGLALYILFQIDFTEPEFFTGATLGIGIGLFLGGIMGFAQKKRKKIVQAQPEKKKKEIQAQAEKTDQTEPTTENK